MTEDPELARHIAEIQEALAHSFSVSTGVLRAPLDNGQNVGQIHLKGPDDHWFELWVRRMSQEEEDVIEGHDSAAD